MGANDSHIVDMQRKKYEYLWDEYKYRHDLIWQRVFRFTTAIVPISIVPYIREDIARLLGHWMITARKNWFNLSSEGFPLHTRHSGDWVIVLSKPN